MIRSDVMELQGGIVDSSGPLQSTKLTAVPTTAVVPAVGFSVITFPAAVVLQAWLDTVPSTKPALVSAGIALLNGNPSKYGTTTCPEVGGGGSVPGGGAPDGAPPGDATALPSSVTAPVSASARPSRTAPVASEIDA